MFGARVLFQLEKAHDERNNTRDLHALVGTVTTELERLRRLGLERDRHVFELRAQLAQSRVVLQDALTATDELQRATLCRAQASKCGFDSVRDTFAAFEAGVRKELDACFHIDSDARAVKDAWKPMRAQRIVGVLDVAEDARSLHKLIGAQVAAIVNLVQAAERGELDALSLKGAVPDGQSFQIQTLDASACPSIAVFRTKARSLLAITLMTALTQPSVHATCKQLARLRSTITNAAAPLQATLATVALGTTRVTDDPAWKDVVRTVKRGRAWLKHTTPIDPQ